MRGLRHDDEQSNALVRHSVWGFGVNGLEVECRCSVRNGRAALLRRGARAGVHQSLVRLGVFPIEAGLCQATR